MRDFGTDLAKYNPFASEAQAIEYDESNAVKPFDHGYTGEVIDAGTITNSSTALATIQSVLETASQNPDNLYVLTYDAGNSFTVSQNVNLVTDGHVKIVKGPNAGSNIIFIDNDNYTLNIGSEDMTGTIEISGGATYTLEPSMKYDFETDRTTVKNYKTENGNKYVLFNDGENYSIAHWYRVGGVSDSTSGKGLIRVSKGTFNMYNNVRLGDVFQASTSKGNGGAVNVLEGKFNMYGGEISWNAFGLGNDGPGSAIYAGKSSQGDTINTQSKAVVNIYDGLIQYNVGLDIPGTGSQNYSADGGSIAIDSATLNIYGGKITNSRGGWNSDKDSGANGGAISGRVGAVINMYGGEISNSFTGCVGGGVALWYAKFHMYGGTITRNYARYGGGAGMSTKKTDLGCEIFLYNNATISENYAEYGGGVSAGGLDRGYNAKFVMLNGNIVNNTAIYQGGGICNYNYKDSALDLRGGTISHNKAGNGGAGVSINNLGTASTSSYLLELSGGISINTNNDVLISELKKYSGTSTYQTPVWVKGRLNSTGTIAMISMNDYSTYVGTDLFRFKREDGGALEVQSNKFSIDTSEYVLNEIYANSMLRLDVLDPTATDTYVARIGDTIYTKLEDAVAAADDGDIIYIINNITLTETIDVDKNITIISETTKTKNDSNIVDSRLKNSAGNTVSGFTYQPQGDYTISLVSNFADDANNTSAFIVEDDAVLQLGDSQYDEEDITISLGGFLGIDGNAGHVINGSIVEIKDGGELKANAGVTIGNNATNNGLVGAGVNVLSGGQFTLNGASVRFNQTSTNGAGVYVAGNMTMTHGHVDQNEAPNGAGIYVADGGNVTISNGSIKDNEASNDGAGIYIATGGNVTFNGGSISDNDADNDGGGVYVGTDATFTMTSGNVNSNRTINGNGAAIYLDGDAYISGGSFVGNNISSYNSTPKGRGILVNTGSELHISKDIYLDSANPVYLTTDELIYVDDGLTLSHAIPMNSEQTAPGTRIAKINTNDATREREIETGTLFNKSIYEIKYNKEIIGETAPEGYYLIYDSVKVIYDRNNAKSGDGILPTDEAKYGGGDVIAIQPQVSGDPITRDGYVFIGWSPVQVSPVTSGASELNVKIYYPTDLVDGVIYNHDYVIYENIKFYAVWAVDANHNGVPDYRENVLDITIAPSENGEMTSSLNQAQGGMFVLLTAAPADGYEVDTIEVKYTLNGVEGTYSLENNKVIKLDEKLFYFNMPLADATVYTTFKVQTINEVKITWNDGTEEEWGTLQSALNEIKSNTAKQGKKITVLKYIYSRIETDIPEGLNIELDLNGHTIDMNYLPFVIAEGSTVKITDSMTGGKISFDSTGGANNVPNSLVNNGTLNIAGGQISTDEGSESAQSVIQNNGTLTMSAGSVKHNDANGVAIYNNGTATLTGGNINGGKYGVYHANTTANSLDVSGFGPISTYGINLDNYLSSIYLAKDAFINVSGVINNCGEDSSVSDDNKIPLYLDETIGLNEPIIKSNKVETMVKHFRMHFNLANRSNNVMAVNSSNEVVLIEKPGKIFTEATEDEYQYRTDMELNAMLYKADNTTPYVGATGTVYFFLLDTVAQWHDVWRPDLNQLVFREGWGLDKAVGSAPIDSETGIATCTISTDDLDLKSYFIFAMYYGDGTYDTYSVDGPVSSGFVGPIVAKNEQQGIVAIAQKDINADSITIESTPSKIYNGQDQKQNIEIHVHDGETLLTEDVDYEVQMPASIVDAGNYQISIIGIGKYTNARNDVTFTVQKYSGQINIEGVSLKYAAGTVPNISFNGTGTATVKDTNNNTLEYGNDYDIKYYKMNVATEAYEEIASLQSTAGVYKIVATCKSNSTNYTEGLTAEAAFVISSDGATYDAILENNTLTYNGRERTIAELGEITVSGRASATADEETLTRDVDYSVMFGTSNVKNAGTYSVIIQGKGEYAELVNIAVDFTIAKKELTKANTTITFTDDDLEYEYNGKTITPSIHSIEIDGVDTSGDTGTPLEIGVDYVTSVSGEHTRVSDTDPQFLFTTLNGNYATTTLSYPFHINPRSLTDNPNAVVSIYQSGFTGEEIPVVVTVLDRVGGISKKLTEDDYTVTYRISDVEGNTASLSNGLPLNKGTYDAIITGKGNYTGEKVETFVVGNYRGRIIATLDPNVFTYTGNESALHGSILNALTVNRGDSASGDELVYDVDYRIGYGTPDNEVAPSEVGQYLLYIVGIGNYDEVQTTTTYEISPLTGTIHIELDTNALIYNGKIQRPELDKANSYMLVDGENVYLSSLEEGRDYAVIIDENSKDVGGYILQVNGIGRFAGNYNFASYQIVSKPISDPEVTIKSATSTDKEYNGQAQTLVFSPSGDAWLEYKYDENEAPVILEENTDFTVVHSNNTNGGIAVAVIAGSGNFGGITTYTFVIESKPINSGDSIADEFTLTGVEDKEYTGSARMQDFVLTDTVLNKTLVEGTDYTVTYQNNFEVGTASYKIEAKGNYKGTVRGTFEIVPTDISSATITVLNDNAVYNTVSQLPDINVSFVRNSTTIQLIKDVDYEFVPNENQYVNAGVYEFSIRGKAGSNYTGTKSANYTIVPYTGSLNVSLAGTMPYSFTNGITKQEIENGLVVTYGNDTLSGDYFDITYTPDGNLTVGNYRMQLNAKDTLANYYESPSSRANGTAFFAIEGLEDISISLRESSRVYTAETIVIPESDIIVNSGDSIADLRVHPDNQELTYVVSWDRPIKDVGVYTLTVKILKGSNELQRATTTFEVLTKNINDADVIADEIDDQFYTGALLKPDFRLEYNEEVLSANDYTAVYSNNKNVGEATITLVGKGNYVGTREIPFEIIRESQGDIIITLTESGDEVTNTTYTYNGYAKTPDVSVDYVVAAGERITLEEGRDYTVSFEDNINSGSAKAIVTLRGNYEGSEEKAFKINKYDLSNANVVVENSTVYNGKVQKPYVEVRRDNVMLEQNIDYEVTYDGSFIDANTYSLILVRALSGDHCNYNGEQQISYTINPYGNNSGETLLLDFVDGRASFKDGTIADNNAFKNLLVVKDLNGNRLVNSNYIIKYYKDGNEITFPQGVGVYTVKVIGTGVNYAGNNDVATRDFVLYLRTANVSDTSATYKNADFNISEIINSIVITSEDDETVVLNKNDFNISFGSTVPRNIGTYTVLAIGKEGTACEGILATGEFTVTPAQIVFTSVEDSEYCGRSHKPEMVIAGVGGETLLNKKDYTVKYSGDLYPTSDVPPTNVGQYNVTVEGLGNYQGKTTLSYEITPIDLADDSVTIELVRNNQIYNTHKQEPSVSVTYVSEHGSKKLVLGTDFEIVSGDNSYIDADTYTASIRALPNSNFVGNKSFEYTIAPYVGLLNVSLTGDAKYTNGVSKKEVLADLVVTYEDDVLGSGDYDVEFSSDILTPGTHAINVTAKVDNTNYSNGTNKANGSVQFTVDPASDITVTISGDHSEYTAHTIVLSDEKILIDGVSLHTLRESNNGLTYEVTGVNGIKDVGIYPITVRVRKGDNELQSASANFTVTKKDIDDDDIYVRPIEDQYYTGSKLYPEFLLSQNGIVLEGDDYEAVYTDNTNVGEATITLVGKNNYEGTREIKFNIVEADGNIIITLTQDGNPVTDSTYIYDGTPKTPDVAVSFATGNQSVPLEEGVDYRVTFEDNIESTSQTVRAKARVTLCGNYSGSAVKEFRIGRFDLANTTVTLSENAVYNGKVQKPAVEVKRDQVLLEQGRDYTLTYNGSFVDAGTYEIVLDAPENVNYTGEKVVEYTIEKYGKNENELLLLQFVGDKAVFNETITKQVFESKLLVKDINGNTLSDGNYVVTYSVDGTTFTDNFPTGVGSYVVKVTGTGLDYAGQYDVATRDFVISVNALDVSDAEAIYKNAVYTISEIENQITISSAGGVITNDHFDISFGKSTPKNVGVYTIIVSGKSDTEYSGIYSAGEFDIEPAAIVVGNIEDIDYTGISVAPEIEISGVGGEAVVEGKDYTITYSGESYNSSVPPIKVGNYEAIVTGKGNYTGTTAKQYSINPIALDSSSITVEVSNNNTIYNTEVQNPIVSVTYETSNGFMRLKSGDYELVHGDNTYKDADDYTFTVRAKSGSNYEGSVDANYTIKPYTDTLNVTLEGTAPYTFVNGVTKEEILETLTVKYINEVIPSGDLDVTFIPSDEITTGNYTIEVKAKSGVTNYYESDSKRANGYVTFIVEAVGDITISLPNGNESVYSTEEVIITSGDVKVNEENKTVAQLASLHPELTYEITKSGTIKNVGTYTITLTVSTHEGNVLNEASTTYTVTAKDITENDVSFADISDKVYTGAKIYPDTVVTYNNVTLTDSDYDSIYSDNKNVGTATITLIGKGNYTGRREVHFDIKEASEGEIIITLTESGDVVTNETYTYDGNLKTPNVSVSYVMSGDTVLLEANRDYIVTYEDNINSGSDTAKVKVTLCGNYSGEETALFTINQFDIANANMIISEDKVYNGKEQAPSIIVKNGNVLLVDGTDYEITSNNTYTDADTYEVEIRGKAGSNYQGTNSGDYTIEPYGNNDEEVLLLEFINGKATYSEGTTKASFEANLRVKDMNGNTLNASEYTVGYSIDNGTSYTTSFPTAVGTYMIKVMGKAGTNYAGNKDIAIRDFVISVDSITVSDSEATYKNAVFTINDIISQIVIKSNNNTVIANENFDITFGSTTPKNVGTYTVLVSGKGDYAGILGTGEFTINPADISFTSVSDVDYVGYSVKPEMTISGVGSEQVVEGKDYTVTYGGSSVPAINVGTYDVVVSGTGNYSGDVTLSYDVKPIAIGDLTIEVLNDNIIYNTLTQNPQVRVSYETTNGVIILSNTDYDLVDDPTGYVNAKEYEIGVTAKASSNYTGNGDATYTIKPYTGTLNVALTGTAPYTFTNGITKEEIEDMLTVKYVNEVIPNANLDVTFTPSGDIRTGNYTIEVKANSNAENYFESQSSRANGYVLFAVSATDSITITLAEDESVYSASEVVITSGDITVNEENKTVQELAEEHDGEYVYEISTDDTIKDVGKYVVTLKVYTIDGNLLNEATATYMVTAKDIASNDITVSGVDAEYEFTGEEIEPAFTLKHNGVTLTDDDYTAVYKNNVQVGTASIVVVGSGNYKGTRNITYRIVSEEADITVKLYENGELVTDDTYTYDGNAKKPEVKVLKGSTELKEGTDYTISYADNVNSGTASVEVTLGGNYTGTETKTFKINKYDLSDATITLSDNVSYNGTEQKPEVSVKRDDNVLLVEDTDYVVTYSGDFEDAGTYSVIVNAKDNTNYKGTNSKSFTITKYGNKDNEKLLLEFEDGNASFVEQTNKDDFESKLIVKDIYGNTLDDDEYDVTYSPDDDDTFPQEAGKYTVTVTGKGSNYAGNKDVASRDFVIYINNVEVTDIERPYNGNEFDIDDIISDISITSDLGTDLSNDDFEISFGKSTPKDVGTYTIIAQGKEGTTVEGQLGTAEFKITALTNIDVDMENEVKYNGSPINPINAVTDENGNELVEGKDYVVTYNGDSSVAPTKEGTYPITITGIGNYQGASQNSSYLITKVYPDDLDATLSQDTFVYNETSQVPVESIKYDTPNGTIVLVKGTDYDVSYETEDGNAIDKDAITEVGKYKVIVTLDGNYEGEIELDFEIAESSMVESKKSINELDISEIVDQIYTGSAIEPEVVLKDEGVVIPSSEYTVTYKNNIEMGNETASITITINEDNEDYTGSKTIFFSIVPNPDDETTIELLDDKGNKITDTSYSYDGTAKKPQVVVKRGDIVLEEGKDYTVSYKNNKESGTATASVTLKGDYTGSASANFKINPLDISNADVVIKPNTLTHTGKEQKPTSVTVSVDTGDGKMVKLKASDYEIVYPDSSKDIGKYKVKVNAKSDNFTGTAEGTYEIIKVKKVITGGGSGGKTEPQEPAIELADTSLLEKEKHNSYITGYDDSTFKPNKSMTRAEVVTVFARLLKQKINVSDDATFTDIDGHWAKDNIIMMAQLGIIKGYDDGTFKPENKITRAEFATMISRFEERIDIKVNSQFTDVGVDHWAYDTVNYARVMGWISGYEDGSFRPNNPITRAEAITIINRMLGRIADIERINLDKSLNKFTDIDDHWAYYGILEATNSHEYESNGSTEIWK